MEELTERLAALLGAPVSDLERMLGGASRETWSCLVDGRPVVVRRDPPGAPRAGAMRREAALLQLAAKAGVPVPEVLAAADDLIVMSRLDGETIARRLLRDDAYAGARAGLVTQCAAALARLHSGVAMAAVPELPADTDPLATLRDMLDRFGEPHPALELGLLRLAATRPAPVGRCVVHGDFRLGNLMLDGTGLVGVLDWELAHVGDPAEDLGWMCVRSWRFGAPLPVAGVGTREELLSSYAAAGGATVDLPTLLWWEAVGTLRWGVICVQQAATHLSGAVRSVELAAIGRRVCEVELDLLDVLEVLDPVRTHTQEKQPDALTSPGKPSHAQMDQAPHDRPTAGELLDAVQEWITGLPLEGRDAFLAKVATRALDIVSREVDLGPALAAAHAERLAALGVDSDAELAAAIRAGRDDAEVVAAVRASVVDKLRVADPRQLDSR